MEKKTNKARVTQILIDKYILKSNVETIEATLRGNIKKRGNILVGDIVDCTKFYDKYMIDKVYDRKNFLIRPPVSNIDQLVIILSLHLPSPDYTLLDKQLILCKAKNITPVICINKLDYIDNNPDVERELNYINKVYSNLGIKIIFTSAKTGSGMESLKEILGEKVSAFSGNSGVGKSSIVKRLLKDDEIEIGDIGKKSNKGKHTTKYVKLYEIDKDSYVLDTPGFSSYELYDVEYKKVKDYYEEFLECKCEYEDCMHANESMDVCDVKQKVQLGIIDKQRYERYVYIYNKLKEIDDKKYKK